MDDRIWKIDIQPYDQVVALTQHTINQAIDNLFIRLAAEEEVDGAFDGPGNLIECLPLEFGPHGPGNWIECLVFGPPDIVVRTDHSNSSSVRLRINLKAGLIHLSHSLCEADGGRYLAITEMQEMAIENWHVTVSANIGLVELDRESPRGKVIEERSAAKYNPAHSIHEVLLDLSGMSFEDAVWELGTWGEDDWTLFTIGDVPESSLQGRARPHGWHLNEPRRFADLRCEFQRTTESLVRRIATELEKASLTSLGFSVTAKDENNLATFEVNHTRYMSYPWTDPHTGRIAEPGLDGNGRLNYLLFLQTVGGNQPPDQSSPEAILDTGMGNWTEGRMPGRDDPTTFGTFILSSRNFMDQFVIPKLSFINRMMTMHIGSVWSVLDSRWPYLAYNFTVGAWFGLGQGSDNEDQTTFKMKQQKYSWNDSWPKEARTHLEYLTKSPGDSATTWTYQDIEFGEKTGKRSQKEEGAINRIKLWLYGDTITFTRLYTLAGSNEIIYEGAQWTKFEYWIEDNILENRNRSITVRTSWKITFIMQEVTDGGLHIGIKCEKPTPDFTGNYDGCEKFQEIVTNLKEMYKCAGDNFEHFVDSIRNCLEHQEKFILPASGVFYFKNPVMNNRGDLVINLEYNGNPIFGGAINPTTTNVRDTTQAGPYRPLPPMATFEKNGSNQ